MLDKTFQVPKWKKFKNMMREKTDKAGLEN